MKKGLKDRFSDYANQQRERLESRDTVAVEARRKRADAQRDEEIRAFTRLWTTECDIGENAPDVTEYHTEKLFHTFKCARYYIPDPSGDNDCTKSECYPASTIDRAKVVYCNGWTQRTRSTLRLDWHINHHLKNHESAQHTPQRVACFLTALEKLERQAALDWLDEKKKNRDEDDLYEAVVETVRNRRRQRERGQKEEEAFL